MSSFIYSVDDTSIRSQLKLDYDIDYASDYTNKVHFIQEVKLDPTVIILVE